MSKFFLENRDKLTKEILYKNRIMVEGLNFEPQIFRHLDLGGKYLEQVNTMFARDRHAHKEIEFPTNFVTPLGKFRVQIRWNIDSPLTLRYEDGQYNIYDRETLLFDNLQFALRPQYYQLTTSDGTPMRTVAVDYGSGAMFVSYSNECSLKDKGWDCLFCNINATKDIYGEAQHISWKTPGQVGETAAAGYTQGYDHITISGGFIPERREVEYYIDVAEAIQKHTGLKDFNGTACVGAPEDLNIFDKYKEAGYSTIATNIEIWDPRIFDVICPGKAQLCGGRDHWLEALKYEVEVFGKYKVRSTMVAGIEPKESLLEGIEYLVAEGVVVCPNQWNVNVGSPLEGHRTPTEEWHWNIAERAAAIYRKYGITWENIRNANAAADTVTFDLFRVAEGIEIDTANSKIIE